MIEVVPGGRLDAGTVPGSTGGRAAMLGLEVLHDTRLVVYGPRSGHLLRASAGAGGAAVGSEFDFQRYTLDARFYRGIGGATVVAAQAVVDVLDGTLPFERMPKLGGQSLLRGYTEPRYRDDAMAAAQLELRTPVRGRFGVAVFAGVGTVAPTLGDMAGRQFHPAGGVGVRFLLDPQAGFQLRVDVAAAPGGGGFYIAAGDAF
jgi:hemolysin activation/secretion protein